MGPLHKDYPDIHANRQKALDELNIKFIRITRERTSWDDMRKTRQMTDALGIKWVYMVWSGPRKYSQKRKLSDVEGFAEWWTEQVKELYKNNVPVEYIELMNEPDSGGQWSTGITGSQYNDLIKSLRPKLDKAGYSNVGILGPGLSSLSWSKPAPYLKALDIAGASNLTYWSTHSWDDDKAGPLGIVKYWPDFGGNAKDLNRSLPVFVTEYATKQKSFHGIEYPMPDDYGKWNDDNVFPYYSSSNTMPFAARVYANTFALLNSGASALFIWQINDEPTEVNPHGRGRRKSKSWGFVDLWGKPKPVYNALMTICPKIPAGSKVIKSPDQKSNKLYSGVLVDKDRVIIGIANDRTFEVSSAFKLKNAPPGLKVIEAVAFEQSYKGNRKKGDPDKGRTVNRNVKLVSGNPGQYSIEVTLPPDSTLTIICDKHD